MSDISRKIKEIRLSKGMTQEQFGGLFNATKGNVSSWENGRCLPNPHRYRMILHLAMLDINFDKDSITLGVIDLSRVTTDELLEEIRRRME